MITKRLTSYILVFVFIFGMTSAAAYTVGSADDPLISKSYIDNTYSTLVLSDPLDYLANSMTVLKFKLNQAGEASAKGVYTVSASPDNSISLVTGASLVLLSGAARIGTCSGTIIDITDGTLISVGHALTINHRYVAAENTTASATIVTAAKIAVYGNVTVNDASTSTFTDVSADEWYYSDVSYSVQKGLVNGRSETIFAPDENLSIAEAIKLAACMHQLYHNGSVTLKNDSTLWYRTYLDYATENGIVATTYQNYEAKITRSEFVAIFYAALPSTQYTQINTISDNAIPDVKLTANNANQIYTFYRAGILIGSNTSGTFFPTYNIKRCEVAAILTRMFESTTRKSITLS